MPAKERDIWQELRKPFPKEVIGKLPRGGIQLDYVGHAAVTDRLLNVDPEWTWEPMATDEFGSPKVDAFGNLWIKLTVGGVTRYGVGDGKNMKEMIGDAIRNAAMRFGVALDLWSKDELESHIDHPELKNDTKSPQKPSQEKHLDLIKDLLKKKANPKTAADAKKVINLFIPDVDTINELDPGQAKKLIEELTAHTSKQITELLEMKDHQDNEEEVPFA